MGTNDSDEMEEREIGRWKKEKNKLEMCLERMSYNSLREIKVEIESRM